jgi:hypothetical protein
MQHPLNHDDEDDNDMVEWSIPRVEDNRTDEQQHPLPAMLYSTTASFSEPSPADVSNKRIKVNPKRPFAREMTQEIPFLPISGELASFDTEVSFHVVERSLEAQPQLHWSNETAPAAGPLVITPQQPVSAAGMIPMPTLNALDTPPSPVLSQYSTSHSHTAPPVGAFLVTPTPSSSAMEHEEGIDEAPVSFEAEALSDPTIYPQMLSLDLPQQLNRRFPQIQQPQGIPIQILTLDQHMQLQMHMNFSLLQQQLMMQSQMLMQVAMSLQQPTHAPPPGAFSDSAVFQSHAEESPTDLR